VTKLRITYNAPVVLTFTIASVVVFVLTSLIGEDSKLWFTAWPHLADTRSYFGLFTHILGHASWQHLISNFMLILLIGPILEERHGSIKLLAMILVTALATGLMALALGTGVMGASGIAFMMILLASMANVRGGEIPLTFIAVATIYLGGEIVAGLHANDGISHMAHLTGGAVGALFGFLAAGRRRVKPPDLKKLPI
jgi:membrane associated rhomboid family serine protease